MFITLGCFSQDNPGVLDRVYSSIISEEFYRKLSYEVVTKSKLICCAENPDSTYQVLTLSIPSDPVYYDEDGVNLKDYYANVLSNGQINSLTDFLVRKVKKNKKFLKIVDTFDSKIYSCLEMAGEFRTKKNLDKSITIYGFFTFNMYFSKK